MKASDLSVLTCALAFLALPADAQLLVKLKLEHASVLQFEAVDAYLSIRNDTAAPFVIDAQTESSDGEVRFRVTREDGLAVARYSARPLVPYLRMLPDEKRDLMLDLSLWYDVSSMGRYLVQATVERAGQQFDSNRVMVEVVRGIELSRVKRNVPGSPGRLRAYSLRYWSRDKTERLFLCVDEEESGENYGVFQLGRVVRVFEPVLRVGRDGTIRIIHQSGVDCYTRSVFKVLKEGVRFIDQTYHSRTGEPYFSEPTGVVPTKEAGPGRDNSSVDR